MKEVMSDKQIMAKGDHMANWPKRIDTLYRIIVRIIEIGREYDFISDTDYVSLLNAHYRVATGMLQLIFDKSPIPTEKADEYKVSLDSSMGPYLRNSEHWRQSQVEINSVLVLLADEISKFSKADNEAVERDYFDRILEPIKQLLEGYREKRAGEDDIVYRLTYDEDYSVLYINGVQVHRTRLGCAEDVLGAAFCQSGIVKRFNGIEGKKINTASVRNNLKLPSSLKKAMFKTMNGKTGLIINTVITRADIAKYSIDIVEVDAWLETKRKKNQK